MYRTQVNLVVAQWCLKRERCMNNLFGQGLGHKFSFGVWFGSSIIDTNFKCVRFISEQQPDMGRGYKFTSSIVLEYVYQDQHEAFKKRDLGPQMIINGFQT